MGLKHRVKKRLKYLINRYPPIGKLFAFLASCVEIPILEVSNFIKKHFSKNLYIRIMQIVFNGRWGGHVIPLNVNIPVETKYLPTQEILEILSRSKIRGIGTCYCRTKHKNCDNPTHTCIGLSLRSKGSLYDIPNKKTIFKKVSKQEIVDILEDCDNRGLIHQLVYFPDPHFFYVICNCCTCCCEILHNYKQFLFPNIVNSDFIEQTDSQVCKNCGICTEICPFDVRKLDSKEKLIVDKSKCMGCGICIRKCPESAIKLIKRKN